MFWKQLSTTIILVGLFCVFTITSAAGRSSMETTLPQDTVLTKPAAPVPGGPGFLMLPAAAFHPRSNTILFELYDGISLMTLEGSSVDCAYFAPLTLPQGATITKMVQYYWDSDQQTGKTIALALSRGNPTEGEQVMAQTWSLDSFVPTYTETTDITEPLVDNQSYAYFLTLVLPWGSSPEVVLHLQAVRIDYSFSTALPLIVH